LKILGKSGSSVTSATKLGSGNISECSLFINICYSNPRYFTAKKVTVAIWSHDPMKGKWNRNCWWEGCEAVSVYSKTWLIRNCHANYCATSNVSLKLRPKEKKSIQIYLVISKTLIICSWKEKSALYW
jgi:hypothetical protein